MNKEELFEIYNRGKKNKIAVSPEVANSITREIKVIGYYILLMFASPFQKIDSEINYVNGGKTQYLDIENEPIQRVYRGYIYLSLLDFKMYKSFWSGIPYFLRGYIFIKSIYLYFKNGFKDKDLGSWLEFYILYNFFKKNKISKVVTRGHYDEVNTWMGEFSKCFDFSLVLFQHGIVLSDIHIPYKIFYSEVYVFDRYSKKIFRNNYVSNPECKYELYKYKASCEFKTILDKRENTIYIGIVEQCNPNWVRFIIRQIEENYENNIYKCYVMLHPNSLFKYEGNNIECTREKFSNIDVLITDFSTLALDYARENYKVKIIYTRKTECFQDYSFYYCENEDSINEELQKVKEGKFI